ATTKSRWCTTSPRWRGVHGCGRVAEGESQPRTQTSCHGRGARVVNGHFRNRVVARHCAMRNQPVVGPRTKVLPGRNRGELRALTDGSIGSLSRAEPDRAAGAARCSTTAKRLATNAWGELPRKRN